MLGVRGSYMVDVVVNKCFGGFGLSERAIMRYAELKGINLVKLTDKHGSNFYVDGQHDDEHFFSEYDIERTDTALVETVKELGKLANGDCAELTVTEVPDGVDWYIDEYDGIESIHESHRSW